MRFLLIALTVIAILGGLFSGGCSLLTVGEFLWNGPRGELPGLQRFVALVAAGVGLVAAAVLAANIWVLRAAFGPPSPRRRLIAVVLACMDLASAGAAVAWIIWADGWHWADWQWSLLAKAGAVALGVKGVLIGAVVGRWWASGTGRAGDP